MSNEKQYRRNQLLGECQHQLSVERAKRGEWARKIDDLVRLLETGKPIPTSEVRRLAGEIRGGGEG